MSWPPPWPAARPRRGRDKVEAEIESITRKPCIRRVIIWRLSGDQPKDLRLTWGIDPAARARLEEELFGKRMLITDHDDWPVPEVMGGYRSQSEAEFSFRQLKDPHVVSFSPMFHWTEHNIHVHVFTCVLALQVAHLMRLARPGRPGWTCQSANCSPSLPPSAKPSCSTPPPGGRPKARRMLTELTGDQQALHEIFGLDRWARRS